ncbi:MULTISPECIES: D-aminoacyl-tRNA deacylase [unclassified Pseudodesulfovibrio]|uniref:D-aminoacyl-tRNA deacylase n=1 Tax=unclassified Pseudodesulfovibrio TaxID=2661612 RepID=UPI000FEBB38D|nr:MULTISPECIES: D-aminoacyl-tRNA deacylase [unclassified Pseudodesulfovibrio]MCJ2166258.1 D-aminoacyl-tRNA deacylase [Pseudodesulfovibrio sp. S3-i]RWU02289.1 D-tyrosyl-tRNA(Tyr) deacylase [Pseudodesulfovibrio sp. S3]
MRAVIQRVTDARVTVQESLVGEIGTGLMVLIGFGNADQADFAGSPQWTKMLEKILNLRIFPDDEGKLNLSLNDIKGDLMLVSQFTLYADCKKGRRPSFTNACHPYIAESLFDRFVEDARKLAPGEFATGRFGSEMNLDFTNWGPVTIILDSEEM